MGEAVVSLRELDVGSSSLTAFIPFKPSFKMLVCVLKGLAEAGGS